MKTGLASTDRRSTDTTCAPAEQHRASLVMAHINHEAIAHTFSLYRASLDAGTPAEVEAAMGEIQGAIDEADEFLKGLPAILRDQRYLVLCGTPGTICTSSLDGWDELTDERQERVLVALEAAAAILTGEDDDSEALVAAA